MGRSTHQIAELHRRAEKALLAGQPQEAHQLCLEILQADRSHADAWFICGVIAGQNRQFEKAVQILQNAVALNATRAEYFAELGKYLLAIEHNSDALKTAHHALTLAPDDTTTLNTLGTVFSHCGEHQQAIECFEKAAALLESQNETSLNDSFRAELYFNMAVSLQFAGRLDKAEAAFERAIHLRSNYFKAHSALATLRSQTTEQNHLTRLEALRESVSTPVDAMHLGHALAKEQEDLGNYREAMTNLVWAKTARAQEVIYDFAQEKRLFDCIKTTFSAPRMTRLPSSECSNEEPIFIVGMPRSGTTLVEQILGSHSQVFPAGELQQFPQQVKQFSGTSTLENLDIETLVAAASANMAQLGEAYIQATRPRTGHSQFFIDKLPQNYLYLGLIHLALPHAKLICLRRDPMDTCLSNYRQLFAVNAKHYHYNLDIKNCGRYYIEFDKLMSHWRDVMPGKILELHYEALVEHPENEVRALLEFCDLPWEKDCLNFHQRETSVATPSAVQVRQGIYSSSVDRWKKYGDAMQPLYSLLKDAGLYN